MLLRMWHELSSGEEEELILLSDKSEKVNPSLKSLSSQSHIQTETLYSGSPRPRIVQIINEIDNIFSFGRLSLFCSVSW